MLLERVVRAQMSKSPLRCLGRGEIAVCSVYFTCFLLESRWITGTSSTVRQPYSTRMIGQPCRTVPQLYRLKDLRWRCRFIRLSGSRARREEIFTPRPESPTEFPMKFGTNSIRMGSAEANTAERFLEEAHMHRKPMNSIPIPLTAYRQ